MNFILYTYIILSEIFLFGVILLGLSMMTLSYFPTSKVSSFIRRHIITDIDLES